MHINGRLHQHQARPILFGGKRLPAATSSGVPVVPSVAFPPTSQCGTATAQATPHTNSSGCSANRSKDTVRTPALSQLTANPPPLPPFRSPTPAPWQASSQAIRSLKMSHRRLPNVTAARLPRAAAAAADKPPPGPRCAGHPVAGHAHESHRCCSSRTPAAR